jgi:hypothetical protein
MMLATLLQIILKDNPMPLTDPFKVPQKMLPMYEEITSLTDAVCAQHLTDEYAQLSRKLTATLSRKRPFPLERGRVVSWAGAILYTIARLNFLFDPSQSPHMRADDLCAAVGVSQNTASSKSTHIMNMLKIYQMDPDWTLPSLIDDNPLVWLITVDGYILDVRYAPREIQEIAYQKGLFPYIPGEK